jgi:hypothetical protein
MTVLIVGGDHITPLRRELLAHGVRRVEHWDGRQPRATQRIIPNRASLVVILYDYVSHGVSNALKQQANKGRIPLVFCRNSTHDLRKKLESVKLSDMPSCAAARPDPGCTWLDNGLPAVLPMLMPEQGEMHEY